MKKTLIRPALIPLLTFGLTLALYLIFYAFYDLFPCGTKSIVWCDMEQQAVPLLVQFKQIVKNGESIAYTVLDAGGMQYFGVFFFFLSNPFSLLILITDIPADLLVGLLVILKLSLSAATAAIWLRYRVPALRPSMQVLLGMMYGCCGYGMFYYQNLMWLDVMAMLPLLMLSLRLLIKRERSLPYFLALSAVMCLCFYLCYMVVLFVVIYTAVTVHYTVRKERRGAVALRFLLSSIFAACLTAFIWLPSFLQVKNSARTGNLLGGLAETFPVKSFFDKSIVICCTAFGLSAIPLLFRKRRRQTNTGKRDIWLLLLLSAAVVFDPINKMWHTGSYQAFPMRWGMIPVLLLLTLAAQELTRFEQRNAPRAAVRSRIPAMLTVFLPPAVMTAICLILHFRARGFLVSYSHTLWISGATGPLLLLLAILFAMSYGLILRQYRRRRLTARFCTFGCTMLFLCEFAMYFDLYPGENANDDVLFSQTMAAETAVPEHDSLSRLKLTKKYTHANMVGATGMPTMAHYTSLTRADYLYGVKRFGYSSYWMEVPSTGGTFLSDLLWHVRYLLGQTPDFPSWATKIWTDRQRLFSAAENQILLPSALYCDAPPSEIASLPTGSRAEVQRVLAERMLRCPDALTVYEPTDTINLTLTEEPDGTLTCKRTDPDLNGEIVYRLHTNRHQALYFDLYSQTGTKIGNPRYGATSVIVNGLTVNSSFPEKQNNGFVPLGEAKDSDMLVRVKVFHDFNCESLGVFGLDIDALKDAAAQAKGTGLHYSRGCYTAHCSTDRPQTLVMAVAYDEGFTAEVNGKSVPVFRVNECQTAVQIPAGESDVTLKFHVQGLTAGLLIGAAGLCAALVLYLLRKRLAAATLPQCCAAVLLRVAWLCILAVVYCIPLLLSFCNLLTAGY